MYIYRTHIHVHTTPDIIYNIHSLTYAYMYIEQKWDKIFYTGSTRVGKIVAKAAAENLTPCTVSHQLCAFILLLHIYGYR